MRAQVLIAMGMLTAMTLPFAGCTARGMYPTMPDLGDVYVAHDVLVTGGKSDVEAIVGFFKQTEEAVEQRNVAAIEALYAEYYHHRGFDLISLRGAWKQLIEEYQTLSLTNVISEIKIDTSRTPHTAQVMCSGALWGIPTRTAKWANVDTRFDEVAEPFMDRDRRAERPPHPFF